MASKRIDKLTKYLQEYGIEAAAFVEILAVWEGLPPEEREQFRSEPRRKPIRYNRIIELYNATCQSFPKVRPPVSEARKKDIRARFNAGYSYDDFARMFEMAEASDFLKGGGPRGFVANFDWLIKDANMAKVLTGNYNNKPKPASTASYDLAELEEHINNGPLGW